MMIKSFARGAFRTCKNGGAEPPQVRLLQARRWR